MLRGFSTLDTCYQNNQCPLNSLDDENIVGQPCFLNECNMLLYTIYAYGISTSGMKIPDIPSTTASQTGKNLPPQSPWTCSLLKPVINAPTSLGISASQARMMVPTKLSLDIAISLIFWGRNQIDLRVIHLETCIVWLKLKKDHRITKMIQY